IKNVYFEGGCNGNLKAISKIVKDKNIDEIIDLWEGNTCSGRPTSCVDQLTIALKEAYVAQNK
ncbi:MAG: TSCPD domain-containing protein, partial [Eggerthellaceae bacterium]|nr:TSCPD domain-containing protein [Eggerthellaceae bacterium]